MRISLIVAAAENGVIGRNGVMPWRMPSDLKHFRATTLGKPVIMGRKTFQSIGKPLDGRDTIVVTRDAAFSAAGVQVAHDIETAIAIARDFAMRSGADEIIVAGGGQIYALALPAADRITLTRIQARPEGDAVFPQIDPQQWSVTRRTPLTGTAKDEFSAEIVIYDRRRG